MDAITDEDSVIDKCGSICCPVCNSIIELFGHAPKWTEEQIEEIKTQAEKWKELLSDKNNPPSEGD